MLHLFEGEKQGGAAVHCFVRRAVAVPVLARVSEGPRGDQLADCDRQGDCCAQKDFVEDVCRRLGHRKGGYLYNERSVVWIVWMGSKNSGEKMKPKPRGGATQ